MFKSFLFLRNFENAQKNIMKSANFFFLFYTVQCTKRRCSEIKLQLKVEIEDGREAPLNPSIVYKLCKTNFFIGTIFKILTKKLKKQN